MAPNDDGSQQEEDLHRLALVADGARRLGGGRGGGVRRGDVAGAVERGQAKLGVNASTTFAIS